MDGITKDLIEEGDMAAPWKIVLIGGEITILAAFTGIGMHLAMQPHRHQLALPPALLLPAAPRPAPSVGPAVTPALRPAPTPKATALSGEWMSRLGREDRHLVASQWNILQDLIHGVETYLRDRVIPAIEHRR